MAKLNISYKFTYILNNITNYPPKNRGVNNYVDFFDKYPLFFYRTI